MRNAAVTAAALLLAATTARAADWPKIDGITFANRVGVTVENPSDVQDDAALVHVPIAEIAKVLPGAAPGHVALMDPASPLPPRRDQAQKFFVPFQEGEGNLIFSVALKPHEKRQLYIYASPDKPNMPGFAMGTGYDSRQAYRSFENRYAAFRMETGPGSNTTGMAIDLFGKTKEGVGLRLAELYQQGHDAYHNLQAWGVDTLKVGWGPGLGGIYLYAGDDMGRAKFQTTTVECVYSGPVETKLKVTAPVDVGARRFTATRILTLVADDRSIASDLTVEGADLSNVQVGLALRDLPNCKWAETPDKGIAYMTGDANQPHYKAVGLGCTFPPDEYVKTLTAVPEPKEGGHIYVLKPKTVDGKLTTHHRLATVWDMDGQLPAPVGTPDELVPAFSSWFATYAAHRDHPTVVELGKTVEKAP